jgi:hypothetical protein
MGIGVHAIIITMWEASVEGLKSRPSLKITKAKNGKGFELSNRATA